MNNNKQGVFKMECESNKIDKIAQSKQGTFIIVGAMLFLTVILTTSFYVETISLISQLMMCFCISAFIIIGILYFNMMFHID